MKKFFFLFFTLIITTVFCQPALIDNQSSISSFLSGGVIRTFNNKYHGIKGSIFHFENWEKGNIYVGGRMYEFPKIQFDGYNNELIYINNNQELIAEKRNVDSFFVYQDAEKKVFVKVTPEESDQQVYMEQLNKGRVVLLAHRKKDLSKAETNRNGYTTGKSYDEFINKSHFYLLKMGIVKKIKPTRKFFLESFPEIPELEKYLDEVKPNLKNEKSLLKMVHFMNGSK